MYVYLKLNNIVKCVSGVTLQDGCCPMVGDIGQEYQLEPALWFKTLIIDSILIDCNQRIIRWGRAHITETSVNSDLSGRFQDNSFVSEPDNIVNMSDLQRTVFEDGDCYDFEPKADELFDSASRSVEKFTNHQGNEKKFKTEILRLLHCFVLPSIQLKREDINALQNALQFTEKKLQTLENEVMSKDRANVLTETSLKKQRERIISIEDFEKESYVKTCNPEFLQVFLKHINKDIDGLFERLQDQQRVVDALRSSTEQENISRLTATRQMRNDTHTNLQKLQVVRETIKNVTVRANQKNRKSQKHKHKQNVFHGLYMEMATRLQQEKDIIHKLCLKKVKISSVREAITLTLDQLKLERSTFGWETNAVGTDYSTNVLGDLGIPESWISLEEQISNLISNPEMLPHIRFKSFCESIRQKIQGSLLEAELFTSPPGCDSPRGNNSENQDSDVPSDFIDVTFSDALTAASQSSVERHRKSRLLSNTSIRRTSTENDITTLPLRSLLDVIKKEIIEHIQEMCQILLNLMPNYASIHGNFISNKIWVCYEKHLYHNIIEVVQKMYERAYFRVSAVIRTKLNHLSYQELGIDDAWLAPTNDACAYPQNDQSQDAPYDECTEVKQPFEEEDDFEHVTRPSIGSTSTISFDKLSLGELYEYADKDCSKLAEFLDCTEAEEAATGIIPDDDRSERGLNIAAGGRITRVPPTYEQACINNDSPPPYTLHLNQTSRKQVTSSGSENEQTEIKHPFGPDELDDVPLVIKPFSPVLKNISDSLDCRTVLSKLKQITKAFRFMGKQVSLLKNDVGNAGASKETYMACCDDILTVTIIVLKFLDEEIFQKFYSQMNLIIDLMPPFMAGSVHDCSLTNFCCAFQYLMDRQVIRQSREII